MLGDCKSLCSSISRLDPIKWLLSSAEVPYQTTSQLWPWETDISGEIEDSISAGELVFVSPASCSPDAAQVYPLCRTAIEAGFSFEILLIRGLSFSTSDFYITFKARSRAIAELSPDRLETHTEAAVLDVRARLFYGRYLTHPSQTQSSSEREV